MSSNASREEFSERPGERVSVRERKSMARGLDAVLESGEVEEASRLGLEGSCGVPSGNGMSSHRGRTSKSRTSFRRALAGTEESLSISASKHTYNFISVRLCEAHPMLEDPGPPSRDQTKASPARSTSAFVYSILSTIDSTSIALNLASSRVKRPLSD